MSSDNKVTKMDVVIIAVAICIACGIGIFVVKLKKAPSQASRLNSHYSQPAPAAYAPSGYGTGQPAVRSQDARQSDGKPARSTYSSAVRSYADTGRTAPSPNSAPIYMPSSSYAPKGFAADGGDYSASYSGRFNAGSAARAPEYSASGAPVSRRAAGSAAERGAYAPAASAAERAAYSRQAAAQSSYSGSSASTGSAASSKASGLSRGPSADMLKESDYQNTQEEKKKPVPLPDKKSREDLAKNIRSSAKTQENPEEQGKTPGK